MRARRGVVIVMATLGLLGCASEPGAREEPEAALARATDEVRSVFSTRVLGDGAERADRVVSAVDARRIVYATEGKEHVLHWRDVETIEHQTHDEKPARPETVYVTLARGSASAARSDAVVPPLAEAGVTRCYVELRDRAKGARGRLARALELFARQRAATTEGGAVPGTAAVASRAVAAVTSPGPASRIAAEDLERELRALERMKKDGLIDDATYARKRAELLARF